ncbi:MULTISPECIES: DUF7507 domain-containing protein [unclassified Kitasatospora]|uniref:DUF7507 domain-containing protein n=1 Tax=unclassified Kitasatospora TaxID=2633591 RepID=UPI002476CEEC|nr:LPXTG cell wall anchor domain-containing protein [Kitasatospora sp. MAP12-44]
MPEEGVKGVEDICHLQIRKTADRDSYLPGQKVTYTITLTNDGNVPILGEVVTDHLGGDLAGAAYDNDATAGSGELSFHSPDLTWVGDLYPGDRVTIVYSLTAASSDDSPTRLYDAVTAPYSNCLTGKEHGCHVDLCTPPPPPPCTPTPPPPPCTPTTTPTTSPTTGPTTTPTTTPTTGPTTAPSYPSSPPGHHRPPGHHHHRPPGELANTGASVGPGLIVFALALLLGGSGMLVLSRRSRRH